MKNRLPFWFKQSLPSREALEFSEIIRNKFKLNTVCHSAKCPNASECFSNNHVTFLILGSRCTRSCLFCNVEQNIERDHNFFVDLDEPLRVSEAVKFLKLEYVVVTSVTRDDLVDGGAQHFADTIRKIKEFNPTVRVEVLIPDFRGSLETLEMVIKERPEVISHNLETVRRMYVTIRNKADYRRSLDVLKNIKLINFEQITKSSIMLGLGEADREIEEALIDLRSVECDMLVLGQYLRPSLARFPVQKFYSPQDFEYWKKVAYGLGFKSVCASPLARTSYFAKEQEECMMS